MSRIKCKQCHQWFSYEENDSWWDYKGMGYDTKLVRCKCCGAIQIIKYWFDNQNEREGWYYQYGEKEKD